MVHEPSVTGFRRIFIANRGEVAVRIARACTELQIKPVFGVSEADKDAAYLGDHARVLLGGARSTESYLNRAKVVQAARTARCSALHPGWGFLAEDPVFASMCEAHGVTFIGPSAHVMSTMGKKSPAKRLMRAAGLPVIEGSDGPVKDAAAALQIAERVGFPVLLKAESGGGGRGMRVARNVDELRESFEQASAEAAACFGDATVYLEKYIDRGRHIEIQILADRYGNVVHLGERDCTVQRNHQKLLEESPALVLSDAERERVLDLVTKAVGKIGYAGAGTVEFLLDNDGTLRFMEMNTRLQVEHPVSEIRSGIDLVKAQIRVAAFERLWLSQEDIVLHGHAIECRINAENPDDGFSPSPGKVKKWRVPAGEGVRVDTHVAAGYTVPPYYDSLLAKVIVKGRDRPDAIRRMLEALRAFECDGVHTTMKFHMAILQSKAFVDNQYDTATLPGWDR